MPESRPRPNWSRPLPRPQTGVPFGVRAPRGFGIYLASAFFFNEPRVNAVAVAVCAVILFTIEGPTQDVSTAQPEETRSAQREEPQLPAAPLDDPVSTSSNGHFSGTAGQPLCVSRDALAAALGEGVLVPNQAQATTIGCQTIAENAEIELLKRFPSGFQFLQIVKVKVTSSSQTEPLVGYTIEISR